MDDPARSRPRLPDPGAGDLPPQELLLPRQPEGLPDLPVRPAAVRGRQLRSARRRRRPCHRDRARSPRGGRREDDPRRRRRGPHPRRRALARRLQPLGHAAGRDRDQAGHSLARGGEVVPPAAAANGRRAWDLGRGDGEGLAAVRRQRLGAAGGLGRAAHADRAQEHELVQLRRQGDRARGAPAGRDLRVRRPDRPGDAPLRPRQRVCAAAALEGGSAGLPLLPGAGPRVARARRGARRAPARRAAGAAVGADSAARGRDRLRARRGACHEWEGRALFAGPRRPGRRRERGHERARGARARAVGGERGGARQGDRRARRDPT